MNDETLTVFFTLLAVGAIFPWQAFAALFVFFLAWLLVEALIDLRYEEPTDLWRDK